MRVGPVELYDKLAQRRGEVGDVRPDRVLPSKSKPRKLLAQGSPEASFGIGRFPPKASGNLCSGSEDHLFAFPLSQAEEEGILSPGSIKEERKWRN